jgi:hypothetical protein
MRRIYHEAGGIDVPEIAEKAMSEGARARTARLAGPAHVMGPEGWCGAFVRHSGMFAATFQDVSADVLKRCTISTRRQKGRAVYGMTNIRRSTIAMLPAIWQSKKNICLFSITIRR